MSVRTISSPTTPSATSQSFSSTTRASMPARGRPHVPRICGSDANSGEEISVMLKTVHTSTPNRCANSRD